MEFLEAVLILISIPILWKWVKKESEKKDSEVINSETHKDSLADDVIILCTDD